MPDHLNPAAARQALAFARAHDWGHGAYLDDGYICGLMERWTERQADGSVAAHAEETKVRASMAALREFGGY